MSDISTTFFTKHGFKIFLFFVLIHNIVTRDSRIDFWDKLLIALINFIIMASFYFGDISIKELEDSL